MGEIADALRRADRQAPASGSATAPPPTPDYPQDRGKTGPRAEPRVEPADIDSAGPARSAPCSIVNPPLTPASVAARISLDDPRSLASQEYLRVAFRLRDLAIQRGVRSIVLTSAEPLDGKTTTACNLATQLARLDHSTRVVLIDFDLHRASLGPALGISIEVGLDEAIRGDVALATAITETDHPGLSILGLRGPVQNADTLLSHPNVARIISDLERDFDFVIIDSPPILAVSDAQMLLRLAGAGLLVARAGKTPARLLKRSLEHIPNEKLIGTLLNSSRRNAGLAHYGYYGETPEQLKPSESEVHDEQ